MKTNEYRPDNWVIVKITNEEEPLYKILAGWSGGYLYGDSWKLNSGITEVALDGENEILFHGYSGSVYRCRRNAEGLRMNCAYIYETMQATYSDKISLISFEDFLNEFVQVIVP